MSVAIIGYRKCLILGGGGYASVLIECLKIGGTIKPSYITDPIEKGSVFAVPIAGDDSVIPDLIKDKKVSCYAIGVGSPKLRNELFDKMYREEGIEIVSAIHPTSFVSLSATIGAGSQLMAHSVIQSCVVLGYNVLVNTGAIIEHDCRVFNHAHIAPGAILLGGATVAQNAMIGAGAIINPGIRIGQGAIVGSGAVVTKNVEAHTTVVGVPAKEIKQ